MGQSYDGYEEILKNVLTIFDYRQVSKIRRTKSQ